MRVVPKFIEFNDQEFLDLGFLVVPSASIQGFGVTPKTLEDKSEVLGIFITANGKDYFFNIETVDDTIKFYMEMRSTFFSREFNFNVEDSEQGLRDYLESFMSKQAGGEDGEV